MRGKDGDGKVFLKDARPVFIERSCAKNNIAWGGCREEVATQYCPGGFCAGDDGKCHICEMGIRGGNNGGKRQTTRINIKGKITFQGDVGDVDFFTLQGDDRGVGMEGKGAGGIGGEQLVGISIPAKETVATLYDNGERDDFAIFVFLFETDDRQARVCVDIEFTVHRDDVLLANNVTAFSTVGAFRQTRRGFCRWDGRVYDFEMSKSVNNLFLPVIAIGAKVYIHSIFLAGRLL